VLRVLVLVAVVFKFFWWILGAVALLIVAAFVMSLYREWARNRDLERAGRLAIAARADEQHHWVMQGDERGVYGEYPPARL
jgi:uncharacterized membrane protein YcjF (UPF0283 family)